MSSYKNTNAANTIDIRDFAEILESYDIRALGFEDGDLVLRISVPCAKDVALSLPEKETLSDTFRSFGEITPDWSGWIGRRRKGFENAHTSEYLNWIMKSAASDIFEMECVVS